MLEWTNGAQSSLHLLHKADQLIDDALFHPHLRFHKSVFKEVVHGQFVAWLVVVHSVIHESLDELLPPFTVLYKKKVNVFVTSSAK
jgi:hypothetical protein